MKWALKAINKNRDQFAHLLTFHIVLQKASQRRTRQRPDKLGFKWLISHIWLGTGQPLLSRHQRSSIRDWICFPILNRIVEREQEEYYKGRPGSSPEPGTLTAMRWNFAKEQSVSTNEHSFFLKYITNS